MRLKLEDIGEEFMELDIYSIIDPDAASELAGMYDGMELSLNGLEELTPEVAEALSDHTYRLELNGLKGISDEVAGILARHEGDLGLDGILELSSAAAESLSRHDGDYGLIFLSGLRRLTDEPGHVLLAAHLASSFDLEELVLDGLVDLHERSAVELARHGGWLHLNGLRVVSPEVLRILSARTAGTSLMGMTKPEGVEWSGPVSFWVGGLGSDCDHDPVVDEVWRDIQAGKIELTGEVPTDEEWARWERESRERFPR